MSEQPKPERRLPKASHTPAELRNLPRWGHLTYVDRGGKWALVSSSKQQFNLDEALADCDAKKADRVQFHLPRGFCALGVNDSYELDEGDNRPPYRTTDDIANEAMKGGAYFAGSPLHFNLIVGRMLLPPLTVSAEYLTLYESGSSVVVEPSLDIEPPVETVGSLEGTLELAYQITEYEAKEPGARIWIEPLTFEQLLKRERGVAWLIEHLLERGVLALLFGPPGTFKTFVALLWALLAALAGFPVVLLYGEGAGLSNRLKALLQHRAPGVDAKNLPILPITTRLDLANAVDMEALHARIAAWGKQPALIVVDTVSKFAGALDESSPVAVKGFLSVIDRELRTRYGATVLLVGHTPHSTSERMRGATNWKADTDAEYAVSRAVAHCTVTRSRFKDAPELPALRYRAVPVTLDHLDAKGKPVTSLVLEEAGEVTAIPAPRKAAPAERKYLDVLRGLAGDTGTVDPAELASALKAVGMSRQTARKIRSRLEAEGTLTSATSGQMAFKGGAR